MKFVVLVVWIFSDNQLVYFDAVGTPFKSVDECKGAIAQARKSYEPTMLQVHGTDMASACYPVQIAGAT